MSYILDALRRAEAERERGAVPNLYARHVSSTPTRAAPATPRIVWMCAGAALLVAAAGGGWWIWHVANGASDDKAPEATPVEAARLAPPLQAIPFQRAEPLAQLAPPPVFSATAPPAAAASLPTAKRAAAVPAPVASAPATKQTAPPLAELPEDLRRQVPALTISGAIYSADPAQRVLVVNNQVLNEGAQAAPEVKLEEIGAASAVFSFRGTRFRLAH